MEYKTIVQSLKTKSSIPNIPTSSNLISDLKEHSKLQKQENLKCGNYYNDNDYVFTTEIINTMNARNVTKSYERLLKKTNTYTHVMPKEKINAVKKSNNLFA